MEGRDPQWPGRGEAAGPAKGKPGPRRREKWLCASQEEGAYQKPSQLEPDLGLPASTAVGPRSVVSTLVCGALLPQPL